MSWIPVVVFGGLTIFVIGCMVGRTIHEMNPINEEDGDGDTMACPD